ncbi:MAG: thioesterase family protein [Myxococcales bacterium]|nr:thioesterase family protein [Myxococcales bacterium]
MSSLEQVSTPRRDADGRFSVTFEDGWQQGRGAYGGLSLALLVRAMKHVVADASRPLRSLSAMLLAPPMVGEGAIDCEVLRAGAALTALTARLTQGDALLVSATGVFAKDRDVEFVGYNSMSRPAIGDFRAVDVVPVGPPIAPTFTQHFEFRPVAGLPFSGGDAACEGWVQPKIPSVERDEAYLAALADAWWPCLLVREAKPRPAVTVSFTLDVVGDCAGLDPEAPLYFRSRSDLGRAGFSLETRELYGHDGRLLAINHQTFALLK